ncbi:MAG TPA: alpha-amylase family protein [Terriglobia bacterium]|nr:alpha-amylase family protein [Terriglobia bacterium]
MHRLKIWIAVLIAAFALAWAGPVQAAYRAGKLLLPSQALGRTGEIPVVYELERGFTGRATLHIHWTDSLGRVVEDKTVDYDLLDETSLTFHIDLGRAVAIQNHLAVDLSLDGEGVNGSPIHKQETSEADFIARPPAGWKDYVIIMWQQYPANLLPALKKLGIDGGQFSANSATPPEDFVEHNMRWYADGLASPYYAAYHYWRVDRPKNWSLMQAKQLYQENPASLEAFKRHPSFWDPYWRKKVHDLGVAAGERYAPYRPYFYCLADETGISELATQWDFDFSDISLMPMRRWLQKEYGSLGALNQEWGTHFTGWDLVTPPTTNEAMKEPGDNFAAWADFKEWMDISYADALRLGADAIRQGDPSAYVAITGGQMPGWGGYDYTLITKVITAIEPYDIGHSVDVVHSFDPSIPIVTTRFRSGPWERHRVWYELLHGNRGLIIWDQGFDDQRAGMNPQGAEAPYVEPGGLPSEVGKEAGEYYHQLRDGYGALIINSHLVNNRIAIHYSQPSMRTSWMLQRRPGGAAWMQHPAGYSRKHNLFTRLRVSWCELIEDEGLQYNFVSYRQIPEGALLKRGYPVLILPDSSSLSQAEANAIRDYVAQGGVIISDGMPGTYDEHSRKLPQSSLADLFPGPNANPLNVHSYGQGKAVLLNVNIMDYVGQRNERKEGPTHALMEKLFRSIGIHPAFTVEDAAGHSIVGIDTHVFADGGVRIITLQSNPPIGGDALGPPDFNFNKRFDKDTTVHLRLPHSMYVYDALSNKVLGRHTEMTLTVGPYDPTILVTSDSPLPAMQISMPEQARRGSLIRIGVHAMKSPVEASIFHIDVRDPQGKRMIDYSGNIIARQGGGMKSIPLAVNDPPGKWTITVHDIVNGQSITRSLNVE